MRVRTLSALIALGILAAAAVASQTSQPAPPAPKDGVLARLDCSSDFPACGVEKWMRGVGAEYDLEQAGNGARFRFRPRTTPSQPYLGWVLPLDTTASTIYVRFHLTVHKPLRAAGVADVWTNKLIIVNNGARSSSDRAIVELKPSRTEDLSDLSLGISKNIGEGTPRVDLPIGRKNALQFRVTRGEAVTFAMWLNNPNCSRPTSESDKLDFTPPAFANVAVGFYANAAMTAGGNVDFSIEDVVVGDACDPGFK